MRHTFRYVLREEPRPGATVALPPADSHHLTRVVRRRTGDPVELIDGDGRIWPATVVDDGERATVRLGAAPAVTRPPAPVVLHQGLTDWGRVDIVVEKAAELGLPRIVLMTTDRTRRVPEPDAWRRRRERLLRVAEAAARQSGQGHVPAVDGLVTLPEVLASVAPADAVLLDPRGDAPLAEVVAARGPRDEPLAVIVGPDAGFSDDEVQAARDAGVPVALLGPGVLRAETAGLIAVGIALALGGYLDARPPGASGDPAAPPPPAQVPAPTPEVR